MKKIIILLLAFALTACGAAPVTATEAPTEAVVQPTQTAMIVVETVVVTVVPTNVPTEVPSATPLPPPTDVPPTAVPPTQAAVAAPTESATTGGPITADDALGGGWFVNLTRSRNDFSLRCQLNKEITFTVKATDPNIRQVDFFYRIEDRATGSVFDWQNAGRMISDGNGTFTIVFSGDKVNANFRKPNAWFDYQFAGSNSTGVIGRSEKIEQQVGYTFDCP